MWWIINDYAIKMENVKDYNNVDAYRFDSMDCVDLFLCAWFYFSLEYCGSDSIWFILVSLANAR